MSAYTSHDINTFKDDGFGHVRLRYNVPLMRGVRVQFSGEWGTITGVGNAIIVKPDKRKYKSERWLCHPTYLMVYHPTPAQAAESEARRQAFWTIAYPDRPYPKPEAA